MKNRIFTSILLACCILPATLSYAVEPKNLDLVKDKLIQYHDSGVYEKDQAKVIHLALEYLKTRLQRPDKKPLAIVLDIDETSLSNYPDMVKMSFGGSKEEIDNAENKGTDPTIQPTLELYRFAKDQHIAVFFVTGRTENARSATERNLGEAGFSNWNGLVLKPTDYHEKSNIPYKSNARKQIESQGYEIVLNIGDQQSDLSGGHADKTFKMPNPFYKLP